ncbi:MAG: hypoxanthine phosphoribosyltransferase [Planctomycetota bacterium]|nr:hypoxanthine phosphoribosyltransferase [Planctomycetota bacterium]
MQEPQLTPLFSPDEIASKVREIGAEIARDFQGQEPVLICVLQGAFVFFADLVRELSLPVHCDFIQASLYEGGVEGSERVEIVRDLGSEIGGRPVIIVEDIVDSGRTARTLLDRFAARNPKELHLCSLLDKPLRRKIEVPIRYRGFVVPDRFIVGYGLDLGGYYRNRPGLWSLDDPTTSDRPVPAHPPPPR